MAGEICVPVHICNARKEPSQEGADGNALSSLGGVWGRGATLCPCPLSRLRLSSPYADATLFWLTSYIRRLGWIRDEITMMDQGTSRDGEGGGTAAAAQKVARKEAIATLFKRGTQDYLCP